MAQQISEIKASARPRSGKGGARAVRREGRVPGVIYGNGPAENVTLDHRELTILWGRGKFLSTVVDLDIDGTKMQGDPARDPARPGQGPAAARRLPARGRRRAHPRQRARALHQRGPVAGPQARRRAEHRAPRGRGDLPGRCHPRVFRVRPRGPRDRPLDPHLRHQDAGGRASPPSTTATSRWRPLPATRSRRSPRRAPRSRWPRVRRLPKARQRRGEPRRPMPRLPAARQRRRRPARRPPSQRPSLPPARSKWLRGGLPVRPRRTRDCDEPPVSHEAVRRPRQSGQRIRAPPPQRRLHGARAHRRAARARALEEALPRPCLRRADRRPPGDCC